jgi:hypothetical protein
MGSSLLLNSLSPDSSPKLTRRKQSGGMTRPSRQEVALKNLLRVLPALQDEKQQAATAPLVRSLCVWVPAASTAGWRILHSCQQCRDTSQTIGCSFCCTELLNSLACVVGVAEVSDDPVACLDLWWQRLEAAGTHVHTQHLCSMPITPTTQGGCKRLPECTVFHS